jgi:regulator of protease activity HflC (stomatin/prohibitin superfamily)
MTTPIVVIAVVALLVLVVAASTVRIAKEYERGVVFRLGRLIELRGPGLFLILPFGVDRLTKVDLRVITLEVPPQEVITSDNVTVKVSAVIFFQVLDARAAITRVFNFVMATSQIAQTTLRAVLGQSSLDELLSSRDKINQTLQAIIDRQTEPWGIKVSAVEVKDAELAPTMVRALARQAEAEREKRAKIIATEGEFAAAQTLADAAKVISTQPAALALRYMQTLLDMGSNQNSTIVFPIPIELIRPLLAAPVPMEGLVPVAVPERASEAVPVRANGPVPVRGMIAQRRIGEVVEHARIDRRPALGEAARLAADSPGSGPERQAPADPVAAGSRPAARGSPAQPAPGGARIAPRRRLQPSARRSVGLLAHRPLHVPGGDFDAGREAASQRGPHTVDAPNGGRR